MVSYLAVLNRRSPPLQTVVLRMLPALLSLTCPSAVLATPTTQNIFEYGKTIATSAFVDTRDGNFLGCGIEFEQLALDKTYKQGAPIEVGGSFEMIAFPNNEPVLMLKVTLDDISGEGDNLTRVPATLANSALLDNDGYPNTKAKIRSSQGETPGSLLTVFRIDASAASVFERIVRKKELAFVFNREAGGLDIPITVDLSKSSVGDKTAGTVRVFQQCFSRLYKQIRSSPK